MRDLDPKSRGFLLKSWCKQPDNMNVTDATNKKKMHLSTGHGNFSTKHKDAG